ncbi:NAD-dependent epimerase/dehydratase family protein [Sulfitobacter sp. LCG007]
MSGGTLVLGASGRLGTMLRAFWPGRDAVWHGRVGTGGRVAFDLLTEPGKLADAARGMNAILCLSGVTPAAALRSGAPMSLNAELALAAIRGAAETGKPRVLLASSAAVYGRARGLLDEEMPCEPVSEYGEAKLAMEDAGLELGSELGIDVCCLRIGNVAGADAILGGWREGFALDRLDDGSTPRRSYIGPRSLSLAIDALTRARTLPARINIAAPGAVAMGDLLDAAGLAWTPREAGPEVIPEVTLATARLSQHIVLAAESGLPDGLVAEFAAFRNLMQNPR